MIDPFAELVQLNDAIDSAGQRAQGRMARVVDSEGHMVRVEIPIADASGGLAWDGPLGPYPSAGMNLVAGCPGVLEPLRGGQFIFVPLGGSTLIPFNKNQTAIVSTTSIEVYTSYMTVEVMIPTAGIYNLYASSEATVGKSTNSGHLYSRLKVNGSLTSNFSYMSSSILNIATRTELPVQTFQQYQLPVGICTIDQCFLHAGAAGTVTQYRGSIGGWFQKIG